MKQLLRTLAITGTALFVVGCASKDPLLGGVTDELYHIDNYPLTITEENVDKQEAAVIQSVKFDASVSDLTDVEQKTVNDNLLVLFSFDSQNIKSEMLPTLNNQIEVLKANPNLRVMLEGRTDDRGTITYNLVLGENRADIIKNHLIDEGVSEEQILTVSLGENEPLFLNLRDTKNEFWKLNRSVFFKFID
jgi:peptidoglycan-associated lipoprotein